MSYFESIKCLGDLKTQYRKLAFAHHPDRGGDLATMQAINAEFDTLYLVWNTCKASDEGYENAGHSRARFYAEQGWEGTNYNSDLHVKDIAALFRAYAKKHWPQCRFSVTSTHRTISISLVSAPFSPWADLTDPKVAREVENRRLQNFHYDAAATIQSGHMNVNHYHVEETLLLSPVGKVLFKDICALVQSYNFDHSDSMIDYFHTNFYLDMSVGKWNKPFTQQGTMPMSETTEMKAA